jgi:hypothetical protein
MTGSATKQSTSRLGKHGLLRFARNDDAARVRRRAPKMAGITKVDIGNIRRVFVDNSTTPVSFWVGSNDGASIVKVEPLD